MDAPQIDAMIDPIRCFWGRLRCLFFFSCVAIDVANLKSSIISPHFLINHWCWKSKPISNTYRKLFPCTLARLWTCSLWMQFTLAIEEISRFIFFRWRLRVWCCLWKDDYFFFNSSDAELIQNRNPVGWGPSGKTWPRCELHLLHNTSVLFIKRELSSLVATCSEFMAW